MDIFTANDQREGREGGRMRRLFKKLSDRPARMKPLKERLRSVLDPGVRKQRREVRKWRRWHESFCAMNEIERRLAEVLTLLAQAAASMKRFGESHSALCEGEGISAFLRDAGLYYRSELEVPRRVETHLGELERAADQFRGISIDATPANQDAGPEGADDAESEAQDEWLERRRICEDLQVDIAVLLESALMAAQQALAEYKKMHCRLELLATEYDPECRLQLDDFGPAFLPLVVESPQGAINTSLPELAVQWALDFSEMVGAPSLNLEGLVRELDQRRRQLSKCSAELRDNLLRRASCGSARKETRLW